MDNKNLAIEFANWVSWNYNFTLILGSPTYIKEGHKFTPEEVYDKYLQEKSDIKEGVKSTPTSKLYSHEVGLTQEDCERYYETVGRMQRVEESNFTRQLAGKIDRDLIKSQKEDNYRNLYKTLQSEARDFHSKQTLKEGESLSHLALYMSYNDRKEIIKTFGVEKGHRFSKPHDFQVELFDGRTITVQLFPSQSVKRGEWLFKRD